MSVDDRVTRLLLDMDDAVETLPHETHPDEIHRKEQAFFYGLAILDRHDPARAEHYVHRYMTGYYHNKVAPHTEKRNLYEVHIRREAHGARTGISSDQ